MGISELSIQRMETLMGSITVLSTNETIDDINIDLDTESKKKLANILKAGAINRENQDLFATTVSINKPDKDILQKGQSSWVKTSTGFALTAQQRNPAHFTAVFQTVVPSIKDSLLYAVEITLRNFSFDFSHARESVVEDKIFYANVNLTIYSGSHTIKILE